MYKTTVQIDGMACSMCEAHVCQTIRQAFSPKKVKASHKKNLAEIVSAEPISAEALHAALDPTGYKVLSVSSDEA